MKILKYLAVLAILVPVALHAQFLRPTTTRYYGDYGWPQGLSRGTIQTRDKGFIYVGYASGVGGGTLPTCPAGTGLHGLLTKLDSNGNVQWVKSNCQQRSYAKSICQTPDGGYATNGLYSATTDGMSIMRYDSAGNFLWERVYGAAAQSGTTQIINTPDHGFMLLGFNRGRDTDIPFSYVWPMVAFPPNDWVLMKLDSLGNKQWVKVFGTSGDEGGATVLSIGKDYYVVGGTRSKDYDCADTVNHNDLTIYTMKFDSSGILLWSKAHGRGINMQAMYDERDNTIMVSGYTNGNAFEFSGNHGDDDLFLMKLDTSGNYIWSKQYGDNYSEQSASFCKGPSNTYMLVGTSMRNWTLPPPYTDYNDGWLFYVDSIGTILDQRIFGGYASDDPVIVFPFDGSYAVLGGTNSDYFLEGATTNNPNIGIFLTQFNVPKLAIGSPSAPAQSFTVTPNPSHGRFEVKWIGNHPAGQLICLNTKGQVVYRGNIFANAMLQSVATVNWPLGNYVVCWQPLAGPRECRSITIN